MTTRLAAGLCAAVLGLALLAGCTAQPPTASAPPIDADGDWVFVAGTDSGGTLFDNSATPAHVVIADGAATIYQPCSPVVAVPNDLVPTVAQPLCSVDAERFADAVAEITTYARDGETLIAGGSDPELDLRFVPAPAISIEQLAGRWTQTGQPLDLESGANALTIEADGTVSGRVLCTIFSGSLSGSVTRTVSNLEFEPGACGWTQSDSFKDTLEGSFVFALTDAQQLTILQPGNHDPIVFEPVAESLTLDQIRGDWYLIEAEDASGEILVPDAVGLTITAKYISGSDGCNQFGADQEIQPERKSSDHGLLPIKYAFHTLVLCIDNQFPDRYMGLLESVETAQVVNGALVLRVGESELRYLPAPSTDE